MIKATFLVVCLVGGVIQHVLLARFKVSRLELSSHSRPHKALQYSTMASILSYTTARLLARALSCHTGLPRRSSTASRFSPSLKRSVLARNSEGWVPSTHVIHSLTMPSYTRPRPLRLPSSHLELAGEHRQQGPWRAANGFEDTYAPSVDALTTQPLLLSPPLSTSSLTDRLSSFVLPASSPPRLRHRRSNVSLATPRGTGRRPSLPLTPVIARTTYHVRLSARVAQQRRREQRNLLIAADDQTARSGIELVDSYLGIAGKERFKAKRGGYAAVVNTDKKRWKQEPEAVRLLGPGERSRCARSLAARLHPADIMLTKLHSVYMARSQMADEAARRGQLSPRPRRRKARPPPLNLGSISSLSSSSTSSLSSAPIPPRPLLKRSKAIAPPLPIENDKETLMSPVGNPIAKEVARRKKALTKKPSFAKLVVRKMKSLGKLGV